MKKRYTCAAALAATMLFGANGYAMDAAVEDLNFGPSLEINKDIDVDTTIDTEIKPVSIDASKETTIDVNKEVTVEAKIVSSEQDISAELKDLTVTLTAAPDAPGGDGFVLSGGAGGAPQADASLKTGDAMVCTGDNFGGIANFQTNTGVHSAAVGGVSISSNANISFGR